MHGIGATKEIPRTFCTECWESFETLGHTREHIATEHIIEIEKHWVFCKKFELVIEKWEVDMLSLIMIKKEAINQLIFNHVQNEPGKFQLQGGIGLVKFVEEDDQTHKTALFVNTAMYHLYFGGASDETISEMVDQMVNKITMFGSHVSGWVIDEKSRVSISPAHISRCRRIWKSTREIW